jgi:hypothetical protein
MWVFKLIKRQETSVKSKVRTSFVKWFDLMINELQELYDYKFCKLQRQLTMQVIFKQIIIRKLKIPHVKGKCF